MEDAANSGTIQSRFRRIDMLIPIFLIFLTLAIVFRYWNHSYRNVIASDGKGYYAYLPALLIFQDPDFEFYFNGLLNIDKKYTAAFLYNIEGEQVIKYPAGVAFLLLPFFGLACLFAFVTGEVIDGYSFWFQIFTSIAAISYTVAGLFWIRKLLLTYAFRENTILWVLLLLAFGTNLTYYTVYEASMSHAYSFAMVALFLYQCRLFITKENYKHLFWCSFALGAIVLIRSLNIIIVVSIPVLADNYTQLKNAFTRLFRSYKTIFALAIFIIIIAIQPITWYLETGRFFVWTYVTEWFEFSDPKIIKVLASYRKGWLLYTPVMLLLFPSLYMLGKKGRCRELVFTFLLFSLAIYLISCWWCWYFGGSFGQRTLIEFYPVAAYPVACLISESSKKSRLFIQSFIILCIVLNLIQSYQSKNNILHYDAMNEEKYWKVFLKTSDKYKWKLFSNPNDKTDPDIENRLLFKCFYDFDAGVKNWIPFINTDIADEALSGNKVLSFSELKQPVRFFYEKDSLIQTGTRLRVKAWFTGDPASMNIKLFQIHNADTLLATDIAALFKRTWSTVPVFGSYSNNWSLYIMDLQIPEISKQNKIGIEINRSGKKIMMDDIMVSLYR